MKYKLSILALCISLVSCTAIKYKANYEMGLYDVDVDNIKVTQNINKDLSSLYEDEQVKFLFVISRTDVNFVLTNKTDKNIKLIWDETVFIDNSGTSHKVFHNGIKFNEKENSLPPSIIIKGGNLVDIIAPSDYAFFESGRYGGWRQLPIIPELQDKGYEDEAEAFRNYVESKDIMKPNLFKVLITLEIDNSKKSYLFSFRVNSAKLLDVK
jgi:hypothetical protein